MATQEIEAKLVSLLPKITKATLRQQQSKKYGRQQTGNKRRLGWKIALQKCHILVTIVLIPKTVFVTIPTLVR